MVTTPYPTAGYIPNIAEGAEPGPLSSQERECLRILARKVAKIADDPRQGKKRDLWYRHNRLEKVRPLILVFPEDSWIEIISENELRVKDPYWRQWEWYLKHLIYRDQKLPDDFVVEPQLYVASVVRIGDWGLKAEYKKTDAIKGSYVWDAPIKAPGDIEKLRYPTIEIDEKATQRRFEIVNEIFADLLPVRINCGAQIGANLIGAVTYLRGIEQVMLDMYDRPKWLHQLMDFVTRGTIKMIEYLEKNGYLTLNNRNHYTDSGGIGYTDELPAADFNEEYVRLSDLWGFGDAQEFSEVSPAMHEEFLLRYQLRILKNYGLNAYGCCEPYTTKFEMLKKIPRLRRVSVSPWCDIKIAAEKLRDEYIYSFKPNPAMILGKFNPDKIRSYVRRLLEIARGCRLEIIHKDTFTINHEPERLEAWTRITREEIEKTWQ